ncbi:hypothetical protein SAMN05216360_11195 [Methylobacterium phyllostachyos]|uniref:Uncharacterized protein n=1 Tax=Methylobacterium phyllostachyos TaxID=582672 RepID=A0A1H0E8N9_9HYPH|nr:hypothetical protein [Methylobacterium phyllostachyos]SDN78807.1 hypothetical protein SAMN05216360_11195 [Methylobacterium phyllostachyos]
MDEGIAQAGLSAGERKHRAKRFNEGLKLAATLLNSSAIATIGIAVINPLAQRHFDLLADGGWTLLLAAIVLHLMGQLLIRFLRPED